MAGIWSNLCAVKSNSIADAVFFLMSEWIETKGGTRISRLAIIDGASSITISDACTVSAGCKLVGRESAARGTKPVIALGKYVFLAANCTLDPSKSSGAAGDLGECAIGNYTTIGENSVVKLSFIGNRVRVGSNCHLGELCVINDCCIIEDGAVVPKRSVIAPFSRVRGVPGQDYVVEELSAAYRRVLELNSHLCKNLE